MKKSNEALLNIVGVMIVIELLVFSFGYILPAITKLSIGTIFIIVLVIFFILRCAVG